MALGKFNLSEVVSEVEKTGYAVLPQFFSPDHVDAIQRETENLFLNSYSWTKKFQDEGEVIGFSPIPIAKKPEQSLVQNILKAVNDDFFVSAAKKYLPRGAYPDRVLMCRNTVSEKPISEWHVDQQGQGRLSIKFMLYLTDTDKNRGAFSYVPSSHRSVRKIMKEAKLFNRPNTELHDFEQLNAILDRVQDEEVQETFGKMRSHIQGNWSSDDAYSIEGPKGTVIFFDTKGLHRGGVVRQGERIILRTHYFEPEKTRIISRIKAKVRNYLSL